MPALLASVGVGVMFGSPPAFAAGGADVFPTSTTTVLDSCSMHFPPVTYCLRWTQTTHSVLTPSGNSNAYADSVIHETSTAGDGTVLYDSTRFLRVVSHAKDGEEQVLRMTSGDEQLLPGQRCDTSATFVRVHGTITVSRFDMTCSPV